LGCSFGNWAFEATCQLSAERLSKVIDRAPPTGTYGERLDEVLGWLRSLESDVERLDRVGLWLTALVEAVASDEAIAEELAYHEETLYDLWVRGHFFQRARQARGAWEARASKQVCAMLQSAALLYVDASIVANGDAAIAAKIERPYWSIRRFVELAPDHPRLTDLLANLTCWSGTPDDLSVLARQLDL
jgi:hypothetical protein